MKKTLLYIISTTLFSLILLLIFLIVQKEINKKATSQSYYEFPSFFLKTIENRDFNSDNIESGPLILVFFSLDCDYCDEQIQYFIDDTIGINDIRVIFVAPHRPGDQTSQLLLEKLSSFSNFEVVLDVKGEAQEKFDINEFPITFIYNENLHLINVFRGPIKIFIILEYIYENKN